MPTSAAAARNVFSAQNLLAFTGAVFTAGCIMLAANQAHRHPVPPLSFFAPLPQTAAPSQSPTYAYEATMGPRTLLDRWNPLIREAAERFHVPAVWLRAVMRNETGGRTVVPGDAPITSAMGALGVMQLMPDTYDQMAFQHGLGADRVNPRDNVMAAAAYLAWLKQRYGFPGMFGAYNVGPGNWEQYQHRKRALPLETRNYVKQITAYLKDVKPDIVHAVHLTGPDGRSVAINAEMVSGVTPALRGEYASGSRTVVLMGQKRQAVRENVQQVAMVLRTQGIIL